MFSNLLLPYDGSTFSALAAPLAIHLAAAFGAKLHVVRVHFSAPASPYEPTTLNFDGSLRDIERDQLETVVERALAAGVPATSELLEGPVVAGLESYVEAANIDLIIMATHGRGGLTRALLGSVAEGLLRRVSVPVLLLHARSDEDDVRTDLAGLTRIVVPLDGSPESEAVLPYAIPVARQFGAEIVLVQADVPVFEVASAMLPEVPYEPETILAGQAEEYLEAIAARHSPGVAMRYRVVSGSTAAEGILRCAREEHAGLIAMSTHGRRGWSRLAFGSVAESVMRRGNIPVLVLPHAISADVTAAD
jgi:nucleotide-binding universal stress UspA family protein